MSLPPGDAAHKTAVLFDVSRRGKLEAVGNDAAVFLHNLSTNDVKKLAPDSGCELFFCTATAKVVAYARVYRETPQGKRERLWLDVGEGRGAALFAHLDHFIIGEDVTLTDRTATLMQYHLVGPRAAEVLEGAIGWKPPVEWPPFAFEQVTLSENVTLTVRESRLLGMPGLDLICTPDTANWLPDRLAFRGAITGDAVTYATLRIEGGLPEYGHDLDETTFAPEVGRTDAISYNKGCYLGQEPIVMARDRGVVQRTLVGLLTGDHLAPQGALLFRDGKEVGRVTSAIHSPRLGTNIALAYARRGSQTPGMELEMEDNGVRRAVKVAKLPFAP